MILFLCDTPFQIMNMLVLKTTVLKDEIVDVYISDESSNNYNIYKKLKQLNILNEVHYINSKQVSEDLGNKRFINYFNRVKNLIFNKKKYREMYGDLDNVKVYNQIYVELLDHPTHIFFTYQFKRNRNIEVYLYEEGVSSYNFINLIEKRTFIKRIMHKIFFGDKLDSGLNGIYLYKPEYYTLNSSTIPLKKMGPINKEDPETRALFNNIFSYNSEYLESLDKKYIYFDQPWGQPTIDNECLKLIKVLLSTVNNNEVCIKVHPRTIATEYDNMCLVSNPPIPYEIIQLNSNVESKVLISIFSTACLNPKIVFDEEPNIILLFKLVDFSTMPYINEDLFQIAHQVKQSYRDKSKFIIPETIEELITVLKCMDKIPSH